MREHIPTILLADDDPGARLLHTIALEGGGFIVHAAEDGAQALELYERIKPDCLVLDVVMPKLTGFDVCREIRRRSDGQHVPILILTSLDDLDSISTAYVAGATDFAQKGINPLLLVERLRFMLRAKELQYGLLESESRLAQAQEMARIGHWELDSDGRTIAISPVALNILGVPAMGALSLKTLYERAHPDDEGALRNAASLTRSKHGRATLDYRVITPAGVERFVHLRTQHSQRDTYVVTLQDMTELRRAEEHIRLLAYFDSLTGMPNRALLHEQLSLKLGVATAARSQVAVIALDLEQFNRINQSLGAAAGDALLRAVAQRLTEQFAVGDHSLGVGSSLSVAKSPTLIARTGGDEFGIALAINAKSAHLATQLQQLMSKLNAPFQVAGQEIAIGATVGAAVFPDDGHDADTLLRCADAALHQAKKSARGSYQFYNAKMQSHAVHRVSLETDLRGALQRNQLELHFQPRVATDSLQPAAVEALLRWRHPDRGIIGPAEFVPIAEDLGIILEIGEWALDRACAHAAQWAREGRALRMAVNVSAVQLQRAAIADQVANALSRHRLDPELLELEVTEGILIDKPELARSALDALKAQNIRIALDDFGTGYSSLSYLRTLPIDYLKIDRSFVADVTTNNDSAAIVATILTLARGLRLHTIAEGVETQAQAKWLIKASCNELQGFLFARAMPAEDLLVWLDAHNRKPSRKSAG